jgi:hypothetical protein
MTLFSNLFSDTFKYFSKSIVIRRINFGPGTMQMAFLDLKAFQKSIKGPHSEHFLTLLICGNILIGGKLVSMLSTRPCFWIHLVTWN